MRLSDDIDVATVDWEKQAHFARRHAEGLPYGSRRDAELDRALACEALAHSRDLLLRTKVA
jgi:hypothetical protein